MDEIETKDVAPVALRVSKGGRVSGKNWKAPKQATKRSHLQDGLKTKSWDERVRKTTEEAAVKKLQQDLKEEKEAEAKMKRDKILDRRKAKAEKERLETMKVKMSLKKMQRMQRRAGRSKKVNG